MLVVGSGIGNIYNSVVTGYNSRDCQIQYLNRILIL